MLNTNILDTSDALIEGIVLQAGESGQRGYLLVVTQDP